MSMCVAAGNGATTATTKSAPPGSLYEVVSALARVDAMRGAIEASLHDTTGRTSLADAADSLAIAVPSRTLQESADPVTRHLARSAGESRDRTLAIQDNNVMVPTIDEHDGFDSIAVGHTITVDKLLPAVHFPDRREVPARSRGWPKRTW